MPASLSRCIDQYHRNADRQLIDNTLLPSPEAKQVLRRSLKLKNAVLQL
jgi:hypothetical protein